MTGQSVIVHIDDSMFGPVPRDLVVSGELQLTAFRYKSGVAGLRLGNSVGRVDMLPFRGQQIWDARFHGRTLTMTSTFEEPLGGAGYLADNGAYLIHCGGSAMGNPGSDDVHPLHGELPQARHGDVEIEMSTRDGIAAATVRGGFVHRESFGPYFRALMSTTLQAGSSIIESTIELTNLSKEPRPLMYLAHLNFRPAVGGRIEESLRSGETTITRASYNAGRAGAITERRPNDAVNIDEMLAEGFRVEPELVQTVPVVADTEGWSRVAQVHSDGSVDVVSHRSADLTHTIRWLRRSADDDAFGFALPATGEADGFAAEQAKGNVRNYAPGASLSAGIRHGMLPARITHRP